MREKKQGARAHQRAVETERNLRALQQANASAALVLSVIREKMTAGNNAVTISNEALSKILNVHKRTVIRATRFLKDNDYVQVVKTGNINTYVVDSRVAFTGMVGQRCATFSSTVVAHECEQEEKQTETDG
ncbi:TPA: hypothetical protein QCI16_005045 [Enterobacter ludwigii]|nr:hypothetical protein [Enterobacter ludwigii]HDR2600793.1 hypothetical protein [Enterobacter ludwigii]